LDCLCFSSRSGKDWEDSEGGNILPQRSLCSLLPLKNRESGLVKAAFIRLLRGMSFGEMSSYKLKKRQISYIIDLYATGFWRKQRIRMSPLPVCKMLDFIIGYGYQEDKLE